MIISRLAHWERGQALVKVETASLARMFAEMTTASDDGDGLLAEFCVAMVAAGLPVWRVAISMPALHPTASSFSMVWMDDVGVTMSQTAHGEENQGPFLESPIHALLVQNLEFGRWRLADLRPGEAFPLLQEMKAAGGTDYVLHLVRFTPGTALHGAALSFATKAPGGFSGDDLASISELRPVMGLGMAKVALAHALQRTLRVYVGAATATHILEGQIRRGEGKTIWAAILLVDLHGFTTLTDRSDPVKVVGWLDEHFEAMGDPVAAHGGEILKYLGDGFLAVFPVSAPDLHPCVDCENALMAALAARDANAALNARRRAAGLPELAVDIVLHFGEVVYGNVGTQERLDFTVVGRAVNEASRLEKSCGDLDRSLLASDTFAERCPGRLVPAGVVQLRGLERGQRVWTVADLPTASSPTADATSGV